MLQRQKPTSLKIIKAQGKAERHRIKVFVRIRPLNEKEKRISNFNTVEIEDKNLILKNPKMKYESRALGIKKNLKSYCFDHIFDEMVDQENIYCGISRLIFPDLFEGFSLTIFAYGSTGSGKTFTMLGCQKDQGIIPRILTEIFETIESQKTQRSRKKINKPPCAKSFEIEKSPEDETETIEASEIQATNKEKELPSKKGANSDIPQNPPSNQQSQIVRSKRSPPKKNTEFIVKISFLEVYNEIIIDLINGERESLEIMEDPIKGLTISNLIEVIVTSKQDVLSILKSGSLKRTKEPTLANKTSSRSHAVFQLSLEVISKKGNAEIRKVSKLTLIDLAGSERAAYTNNKGERLREGANINKSLLSLGNCINALASNSDNKFIPFRDSKLTRLLKDSFCGNCKTIMIANVSPSVIFYEDTLNTLKYAHRAMCIKTEVFSNMISLKKAKTMELRLKSHLNKNYGSGQISQHPLQPNKNSKLEYKESERLELFEIIGKLKMENELIKQKIEKQTVHQETMEMDKTNINNLESEIIQHFAVEKKDNEMLNLLRNQSDFKTFEKAKKSLKEVVQQRKKLKNRINQFPKDSFFFNYFITLYKKEIRLIEELQIFEQDKKNRNFPLPKILNSSILKGKKTLQKNMFEIPDLIQMKIKSSQKKISSLEKNKDEFSYQRRLQKAIFEQHKMNAQEVLKEKTEKSIKILSKRNQIKKIKSPVMYKDIQNAHKLPGFSKENRKGMENEKKFPALILLKNKYSYKR